MSDRIETYERIAVGNLRELASGAPPQMLNLASRLLDLVIDQIEGGSGESAVELRIARGVLEEEAEKP